MNLAGEAAALGAALSWTICTILFTKAGKDIGSLSVNIIRLMFAGVFLIAYGLISRGHALPTDAPADAWLYLGLSGFIGFFLGDLCLFRCFLVLGPRLSLLMMTMWTPISSITAWLVLGASEALSFIAWIGMGTTLAGIAWVIMEKPKRDHMPNNHKLQGILLGIGAALGQGIGYIIAKIGQTQYKATIISNYSKPLDLAFASTQIRCFAALAGFMLLFTITRRWGKFAEAIKKIKPMVILSIGAFIGPFVGVALSLLAIHYTKVGIASTLLATSPILVLPFSALLFKEKVSPRAILGVVISISGIALISFAKQIMQYFQ